MKQWHYTSDGAQKGPVSTPELIELLTSQQLTPDSMVWTEGLTDWKAAGSIDELRPSPYAPPTAAAMEVPEDLPVSGSQIRPWIRYWARMIDLIAFGLVFGIVGELIYPDLLEIPDIAFNLLLFSVYSFVEPIMFTAWGSTPGKALLRVRVRNADGSRLSFRQALSRAINVWIRGLGLGIPIVAFFTQITAYNRLTKQGRTSWDQDGNHSVNHQSIQYWRILIIVLIPTAFIALIAIGLQET